MIWLALLMSYAAEGAWSHKQSSCAWQEKWCRPAGFYYKTSKAYTDLRILEQRDWRSTV